MKWLKRFLKWIRLVMSQELKLEARGLFTNPSDLQRPEGSLAVADNITISREGIIEPRKGFKAWLQVYSPTATDYTKMWPFGSGLVLYSSDAGSPNYITATQSAFSANTTTTADEQVNFTSVGSRWATASGSLYIPTNITTFKKNSLSGKVLPGGSPQPPGMDRDDRVATAAIGAMSLTSNTVTVNTSAAHGYFVGMIVTQTSATEAPYAQGNYTILTVPSTTQFTYALTAGNDAGNANAHTFQPAQLQPVNGWLADGFHVAYRCIINLPDANQQEIVSAPSPRCIIANSSAYVGYVASTNANPIVRFFLPKEVDSSLQSTAILRVYRSKAVETSIEPSDEMGLVFERGITASEWTRQYVDVLDITPDSLRGEALYTSPSQEGLIESNNVPPIADALVYDGSRLLFGGQTTQAQQLIISLLAVGGANGLQNNQQFILTVDGSWSLTVTGVTGTPSTSAQFKIDTSGTDAQNIRNTALNLCAAVNRQHGNVYAYYISAATDAPGKMLFKANQLLGPSLKTAFTAQTNDRRDAFFPTLGTAYKAFSLTRVGSTVTATVSTGTHNFRVGDDVEVFPASVNFPAGPFTVLTVTSTTLTFTSAGTATTETRYLRTNSAPKSSNDAQQSRVYESKPFLPDAVPPLSYSDVGNTNKPILAMAVVRNQVFAFKDDGLFIRTAPLTWELFDETVKLVAPRSVVTLLNNVYAWTTQGIVAINDTGVEIVSRPIEKTLNDTVAAYATECRSLCFAIANETDRTYSIAVPSAVSPAFPSNVYTFNTITRTWTRENITGETLVDGTTGVDENLKQYRVFSVVNKGPVIVERRANTKADYQDPVIASDFKTPDSKTTSTLVYSVAPGFVAGDMIVSNTGNIHLVTSVVGTTYNVSPNITLTDTDYIKCKAINSEWQYNPIVAENADLLKLWRQANMLWQNCHVDELQAAFSTELVTGFLSQTVDVETIVGQWGATWDGAEKPFNLSLLIPQEVRRGTRLNVKFTLAKACQVFAMNGLGLRFTVSGDKVSK